MTYNEISLDEIDWDDETFRISEDLDPAGVLDSLRAIGLLNPMVVLDREPRKPIVCGFRRGRALKKLGHSRIPVRILPSEETQERIRIFELALWDNLSHRQLNPLEKARVIYKLQAMCGVPDEMLIRVYLPLLGLTPHESVLQAYLALNGAQPGLRQCLADGRLTLSSVEMLSKTPDPVQVAFSSIMTKIRLSASSQRKVLGLLEDLAAMAESRLDAPLNIPEVSAILEDSRLSPFQKGDRIYEALYCVRNPRLSHAHERFHSRIQQLELPGSIRLTPHPFFETAELHVEFEASDGKRFRELSAALQKASQAPELEELFQPE